MSGLWLIQKPVGPASAKESCPQPCVKTLLKPGSLCVNTAGASRVFVYVPMSMGNEKPGCQLFTGIEIATRSDIDLEEVKILIKTTVDSYPDIPDSSTLLKIEELIEHIYNELHGNKPLKIDSIQVVRYDQATEELRHHILTLDCPACHRRTTTILTHDLVHARATNPNPVTSILFKKDKTECGHSFIAFIDRSLKVKGYEAIDM
ncbi:MAG: hypothetical protein Q6353_006580 [Candidatus Sigynarchaeum springense]